MIRTKKKATVGAWMTVAFGRGPKRESCSGFWNRRRSRPRRRARPLGFEDDEGEQTRYQRGGWLESTTLLGHFQHRLVKAILPAVECGQLYGLTGVPQHQRYLL